MIELEVVYASSTRQVIRTVQIARDATIQQAIERSGILTAFPEIDLTKNTVGVFSRRCALEDIVTPGTRIEIYRELLIDPKESRRRRAKR